MLINDFTASTHSHSDIHLEWSSRELGALAACPRRDSRLDLDLELYFPASSQLTLHKRLEGLDTIAEDSIQYG